MKKMQWVDLFKTIKSTRVSFIAIILFIVLGMSDFLGTQWSGPALVSGVNSYYKESQYMDLSLSNINGFSANELKQLKKDNKEDTIEGGYTADVTLKHNNKKYTVNTRSLTDKLNKATVKKGRLPEKKNEVAIDSLMAKQLSIKVGDKIDLNSGINTAYGNINQLESTSFTVTGLVSYPAYISTSKSVNYGMSLSKNDFYHYFSLFDTSAYNQQYYQNHYSSIYIRCKSLENINSFSSKYINKLNSIKKEYLDQQPQGSSWSASLRNNDAGYHVIDIAYSTSTTFAYAMGSFFIIVGLLVCYSAITRIVKEQQKIIGTQKALGFRQKEITRKYVLYTVIAVIAGSVLGFVFSLNIEYVCNTTTSSNTTISDLPLHIDLISWILFFLFELIIMTLVSWLSCRKLLDRSAMRLLNDDSASSIKPSFFEKLSIWKKMSLFSQSTIYNFKQERARVIATIIGVIGCISLIIGPMTMFLCLSNSQYHQYGEIYQYSYNVKFNSALPGSNAGIKSVLDKHNAEYYPAYLEYVVLKDNANKQEFAQIMVVENAADIKNIIKLTDWKNGSSLKLDSSKVYLWNATARDYDRDNGDKATITTMTGEKYSFVVNNYYKSYSNFTNRIIMTKERYKEITGKQYSANTYLFNAKKAEYSKIKKDLKTSEGYISLTNEQLQCSLTYKDLISSLSALIGIAFLLSIIIAFLVLFNLSSQMVYERKKQLIVMRINGYSIKKTKQYVFRDNMFVIIIGIIIGNITGCILGSYLIKTLTFEGQYYLNQVNLVACLIGTVCTLIYGFITTYLSTRKISKLDLSDINKL